MKNKKKTIKILIFSIIGILYVLLYTVSIRLETEDNLWNFGAIYKLCNGYKMYTDIGIITAPLFFEIGKCFFKIFGANFFVFYLYGTLISLMIALVTNKIMNLLKMDIKYKIIVLILLFGTNIFCISNYNPLALLFLLVGLAIDLKPNEFKNKNMVQGLLGSIIFYTNQKTVVAYIFAIIIVKLINEKKLKIVIKELLCTSLYFALGVLIGLICLYINGNLESYFNICILGVVDFHSNFHFESNCYSFIAIYLLITIISIIMCRKTKNNELKRNIIILLVYALCETINIYPILNKWHCTFALSLYIILGVYELTYLLKDFLEIEAIKKTIKAIIYCVLICASIFIIFATNNYILWNRKQNLNYNNPYYGAIIENDLLKLKEVICKYISNSNKRVIVINIDALLYGIELNRFNGYYDMPLRGNIGLNGEQRLIDDIKKMKNTIILLPNDEIEYTQYVNDVRAFVKNTYTKTGEIEHYDIYEIEN